jgi:hypothetical protein
MAEAILDKDNLESIPHENILTILDNRSNISDPRNPNSTEKLRQFIYDSDPFNKAINFEDFPYIISEFPTISYEKISTNGKVKTIKWQNTITIRAVRSGSANTRSDVGRTDMMAMGNDLNKTVNSATIKQTLSDVRIHKLDLTKLNVDTYPLQTQEIYEWTYQLNYEERFQVTD